MKFCKYCGKQIPTGSTCSCKNIENNNVEEENIIDLGLEKTIVNKNYIYCSNCGKKILEGNTCDCLTQKENNTDSFKIINNFLSKFFKAPKDAIINYLKDDSFISSIIILVIAVILLSVISTVYTVLTTGFVNYYSYYNFIYSPIEIIIMIIKNIARNIIAIGLQVTLIYIVLKEVFKVEKIEIKDTFNITAIGYIPSIITAILALIFGVVSNNLYSPISSIGLYANILIVEEAIRHYFKLDDNKILLSVLTIFSLTRVIFFVIISAIN